MDARPTVPSSLSDEHLRILIIDDQEDVRRTMSAYFEARRQHVLTAGSGEAGLQAVREHTFDVVITDVRLGAMDGFQVLGAIRRESPSTEVIVMTGYGDVDDGIRAMREGAFDYCTKPLRMKELEASLQRTSRFHALRREKERVQQQLEQVSASARSEYGIDAIVGASEPALQVKEMVRQVASTDAAVLVHGETGTGKELVARAIHYEGGRAAGAFIAVNCTSIPENLLESELFGHVKGAFTDAHEDRKGYFEQADGGTLFLDEIGDMPLSAQTRLLRVLEERRVRRLGARAEIPVDVRIVAASNRDLQQGIAERRFREDLYYRLNTVTIQVPPLRQRREDILLLARHFAARFARELRRPVQGFTGGAKALLQAHPFPGNVRELRNVVERGVIFCTTDYISPADLQLRAPAAVASPEAGAAPAAADPADADPADAGAWDDLNLDRLEAMAVTEAMRRTGNNQVRAAALLGISRTALRRRLAKHSGD